MAKGKKRTVELIPHKIAPSKALVVMKNQWGNAGYAFWFQLMELLGESEEHYVDCNDWTNWRYLISKTSLTEKRARDFLDTLAELNTIDPGLWDRGVIWSEEFVNSIAGVYKRRKAKIPRKPEITEARDNRGFKNDIDGPEEKADEGPGDLVPLPEDESCSGQVLEIFRAMRGLSGQQIESWLKLNRTFFKELEEERKPRETLMLTDNTEESDDPEGPEDEETEKTILFPCAVEPAGADDFAGNLQRGFMDWCEEHNSWPEDDREQPGNQAKISYPVSEEWREFYSDYKRAVLKAEAIHYPPGFDIWWNEAPRTGGKAACFMEWLDSLGEMGVPVDFSIPRQYHDAWLSANRPTLQFMRPSGDFPGTIKMSGEYEEYVRSEIAL